MRTKRPLWKLLPGYWCVFLVGLMVIGWFTSASIESQFHDRATNPRSVDQTDRALSRIRLVLIFAGCSIAGLAAALGLVATRQISVAISQLRDSAQRLLWGEAGFKIDEAPFDELRDLSEAVSRMAHQLEERSGTITRQGHEQQAILASMVEGVLAVDRNERVITLNFAAETLLGASHEDATGRGLQEVIRNADLRRFVTRTLGSDRPIEDDVVLRADNERVLQAHGTALRDGRGQAVGAVIVLNEVTHLRRLENIRRDFVANVSHELKTPITSIKGFVETLLDGAVKNPEDADRFLRIIARQADRLNSIIEDLLSLSKIEQSADAGDVELEQTALKDVLQSAIDQCEHKLAERNIRVQVSCEDSIQAHVNPPLLEQAIMNLLDNAIKYSDPGKEIHVDAALRADEVAVQVRDEGCGIEEEHLDRLFERFYRVDKARSRKLGGTGLGLSIVKHIVHAHGGHVTVESAPGKGSTFTIHLPRFLP